MLCPGFLKALYFLNDTCSVTGFWVWVGQNSVAPSGGQRGRGPRPEENSNDVHGQWQAAYFRGWRYLHVTRSDASNGCRIQRTKPGIRHSRANETNNAKHSLQPLSISILQEASGLRPKVQFWFPAQQSSFLMTVQGRTSSSPSLHTEALTV